MSPADTQVDRRRDDTGSADAVACSRVTKAFGETTALNEASLTARFGEIHAVVGENGSGKSTLIKAISGVHPIDGGEVRILGRPIGGRGPAEPLERGLATVFQEVLVAEGASALENVFIGFDGLWRSRLSRRRKLELAAPVLTRLLGYELDLDRTAGSLTLSERQVLTVARALVREPRVLILDESTSSLDLATSAAVMKELVRLKQEGVCVVLVTHRIAELEVLADRATVLRDGSDVGELRRGEFSEETVLRMMGGETGPPERREAISGDPAGSGPVLLRASAVRLREGSEPFELAARSGEVVGLAGLEGHGQVEFIRGLAGVEKLREGRVEVLDPDGAAARVEGLRSASRHGLAYASGDRKLEGTFPDLSTLENFGLPTYSAASRLGLIRWRRVRRAFGDYVARLKIALARPNHPISSLSGGNQQKVLLARWLAAAPRALLLNDPTRGVDVGTKRDIYAVLREFVAGQPRTVVVHSTEIEELVALCDRILVFRDGSIGAELERTAEIDEVLAAMFGAKGIESVIDAERETVRRAGDE